MKKRTFMITTLFISVIIISLIIYNNSLNTVNVPSDVIENIVKNDVEPTAGLKSFGGKVFCDYSIVISEEKYGEINVYLWLYSQELYVDSNKIKSGTGTIDPAVLHLKKEDNTYILKTFYVSSEAAGSDSMRKFPLRVRNKFKSNNYNFSYDTKLYDRAREYFKI
ncbi:hypothetical protein [Clostridium sp. 'White wine YQ']|uniref:hypothetical protein n=1 Tax=Clostridium sp. 'White wine YQ' TaxID=3027474 RepID=UPI00236628CB|nr:hypothetical protein [Clostridium sp. 'White wine YQ']MDD7796038.1 hypothetical protein [Clostridium sp. 'White wine YQ']